MNSSIRIRIFYFILFGFVIFALIYYVEKYAYKLIHFIFAFNFFSICIDIILHILLMRYIAHVCLFPASNFFIKKILQNENGQMQAIEFSKILNLFMSNLEQIKTSSNKQLTIHFIREMRRNLMETMDIISYFIRVYSQRHICYPQSEYQKSFFSSISILNENIKESGLTLILDEIVRDNSSKLVFDFKHVNLDRYIQNMLLNADVVEDKINDYLFNKSWIEKLQNFWSNDIFGSYYQYRTELFLEFQIEEYLVESTSNHKIDLVLIKSEKRSENELSSTKSQPIKIDGRQETKRNLIIFCGPNGAPYEQFSKNLRLEELYLDNNIDIILWNYRGYGYRSGFPNFSNIKKDAKCVLKFAQEKNLWNKIGVHGLSIGGLPCCSLAATNLVDVCIADRTFSSIDEVVLSLPFGNILQYFYKLLLFSSTSNVENYLKSNCTKIILNDPLDNIIKDEASLKTGISKEIINRIYFKDNLKRRNFNSILEVILTKPEREDFQKHLYDLLKVMLSRKNKKKMKDVNVNINSNTIILLEPEKIKREVKHCKNHKDKTINEQNFEDETNHPKNNEISEIINEVKNLFAKFESTGNYITSIRRCGDNKSLKNNFIDKFFTNMFVWDYIKNYQVSSEGIIPHEEIPNKFKTFIKNLEFLLNKQEVQYHKKCVFVKNLQITFGYLKKMELSFSDILLKPINNNSFSFIGKFNIGKLISISCGHNGDFSDSELHLLRNELIKIKFIQQTF